MEVSYKRRFSNSYMILDSEDTPEELHELEILAHNKVPGLLPVETEVADGHTRFWYDITGKQSLADYLGRKQADSGLLQLLFQALEQMCQNMQSYLLDEEKVILEQEYLYLDFEGNVLELVYLPGRKQEIRSSFQALMEVLLQKLNHGDKLAVAVAYEMYQLSLQREQSFSAMLKQALEAGAWQNRQEGGGEQPEIDEPDFSKHHVAAESVQEEKRRGVKWLKQKIFPEEACEEEACYVTRPEEPKVYPTEILKVKSTPQGILVFQGRGNQPDIKIDKPLYLIGKKAGEVDGCISLKTVSRVHARIELEQGSYYMEDMNSTNGTFLNGERLEYRQKVKLKAKDRISFGMAEYVFM